MEATIGCVSHITQRHHPLLQDLPDPLGVFCRRRLQQNCKAHPLHEPRAGGHGVPAAVLVAPQVSLVGDLAEVGGKRVTNRRQVRRARYGSGGVETQLDLHRSIFGHPYLPMKLAMLGVAQPRLLRPVAGWPASPQELTSSGGQDLPDGLRAHPGQPSGSLARGPSGLGHAPGQLEPGDLPIEVIGAQLGERRWKAWRQLQGRESAEALLDDQVDGRRADPPTEGAGVHGRFGGRAHIGAHRRDWRGSIAATEERAPGQCADEPRQPHAN